MTDLLPCYWCEQQPRNFRDWRRVQIACCDFFTQPHPTFELAAAEWNAHQEGANVFRVIATHGNRDVQAWLRSLGFDDPAPVEQLLNAEWNYQQLETAFLAWKARRER